MQKIRIITDSGSDISQSFHEDIRVLPMTIRFGEEEFLDGVNISTQQFYEKLIENNELPTTSLISPGDFEDAYLEALSKQEKVLVVTISGKLSGTYQSALLAAQGFPGDVFVVDSKNVAIGEQILVLRALSLIEQGFSVEKVAAKLESEREKIHIIALLDTLEYLQKGGRISRSAAFFGGALSVKPVVSVKDGEVALIGKARGSRNGNNFLIKEIESTNGVDFSKPIRLGYTGLSEATLRKYIEDSEALWAGHGDSIVISPIGSTIGTHIGPGAIAVAFFEI